MHRTPTLPDSEHEAMRRERDMQANAIRDVFLEERMKKMRGAERLAATAGGRKAAKEVVRVAKESPRADVYPVGEARGMRAHILGMSLFPNVYNRHMLMSEYGAE